MSNNLQILTKNPIAIIDIGSNSIRMVIYEKLTRALTPLYNEKSICSLGKGVALNGNLARQNVEKALKTMRRFALVLKLMQVKTIYCIATSAVRKAKNGAGFAKQVEKIIGTNVKILTGQQEAHYAALGTIAGMPNFSGIVGDLGGGSLELSSLANTSKNKYETFELGVISLMEASSNSILMASEIATKILESSNILQQNNNGTFCAIGGTWRAIAKLHQVQYNYPLHMVQNYQIEAKDIISFCDEIYSQYQAQNSYLNIEYVSSTRSKLLPFGALLLSKIMQLGGFANISFSALGVREGFLFSKLDNIEQQKNPLIETCNTMSLLRSRSYEHCLELIDFSEKFLTAVNISETKAQTKLRKAACLLSDISWRGHPDYRGEQAIDLIAFASLTGVDHQGRAFLAKTLATRYMGLKRNSISSELLDLAGEEASNRASLLGALFRVAFVLSASMAGVLGKIKFTVNDNMLELILPHELAFLEGSRLKNRLTQLAKQLGLSQANIII